MLVILLISASVLIAQTTCEITLTGDWSSSSLHIHEVGGVDITINSTQNVTFQGTGSATFTYSGINGTNTFEFTSCAGQSHNSGLLNDGDIYTTATPLPVGLISFVGQSTTSGNVLNWITEWEINNKGFHVQKVGNFGEWTTIGFVLGKGNDESINSYMYEDNDAKKGQNYYRLIQEDFDGTTTYSDIIEINTYYEITESVVYADNVNKVINIQSNNIETTATLYNSIGVQIAKRKIDGRLMIDMSKYNSGVYFVRIGNETSVKRVILL